MSHSPPLRCFWKLTALLVMCQLAFVQAMAASAELHKHFHCHEHEHEHEHEYECAVTLMLHGGYIDVVPDIVAVDLISDAPDVPALAPKPNEHLPSRWAGGVLAHAPPRGP